MKRWRWLVIAGAVVMVGLMLTVGSWGGRFPGTSPLTSPGFSVVPTPVEVGERCLLSRPTGWASWTIADGPTAVYALYLEGDTLWVGSGMGVRRMDVRTRSYEDSLPEKIVHNFLPVGDGRVWAASNQDLLFFDGNQWQVVMKVMGVQEMVVDAQGQLEVNVTTGMRSSWGHVGDVTLPPTDLIHFQPGEGPGWGQYDCQAWPRMAGRWRHYGTPAECRIMQAAETKLHDLGINPNWLEVGPEGVWWMTRDQWGLLWPTGENQVWESLPVRLILALEAGSQGGLWMGTYQGLAYFDPQTGELSWVEDAEQGIPMRVIRTRDGRIWLVRSDRLVMFHPEGP